MTAKRILDFSMILLMPVLMAYSLVGEKLHELAGLVMFALFLLHHIFNRKWLANILRGRYTALRSFQTAINLLLLFFMILQPLSGVLMSKHILTSVKIPGMAGTWRAIHLCLAYWGFVLLGVHAGMHLASPLGKLRRKNENVWRVLFALFIVISLYACAAFVRRGFPSYMFLRAGFAFFDSSQSRAFFFLDYAVILVLFATIGYTCCIALQKRTIKTHRQNEREDNHE